MKRLFVCSENTARSPTAQFVMQKLVTDADSSDKISVSNAASRMLWAVFTKSLTPKSAPKIFPTTNILLAP